ncbi:hypothetical protein V2W30_05540 [Streptomyces sp. Q6]|uniref:Uncharacterized protein n=1 Tax=Streptomyces citrinus TaxID=3118173 RepID=A0ACD5A717_9ACTN
MPGPLSELLGNRPLTPAGRVKVPDVTCRAVWDAVPPDIRASVLADAARELDRPEPRLSAGAWARAFRDGNRGAYENAAWDLQERVSLLALAAVLTGEAADATSATGTTAATGETEACPHLDAAIDGLMAFAEASSWCWAPHDRFTAERGEWVPDPDDPYLDLGAAEVAALFAWADHALGPHLDRRMPGLRRRLRREVERRVLLPFERRRDWRWIGADGSANNWNPWIHGAVLACALLLCDDDARRARLVGLVVEGLDPYVATLPDDGGIDEGIAYWWVGACRLLEILDLLAEAGPVDRDGQGRTAAPALDARRLPLLAELLRYPQRMHLGGAWYVNVGDAPARLDARQPWQVPFRWGVRLGQPETVAHAVAGARGGPRRRGPGSGGRSRRWPTPNGAGRSRPRSCRGPRRGRPVRPGCPAFRSWWPARRRRAPRA